MLSSVKSVVVRSFDSLRIRLMSRSWAGVSRMSLT
jgi:hypothetical protein